MRGARLVLVAALAGCGSQFQHVGPAMPVAGSSITITIDRIVLQWSNVYLIRKADAAVLVDAGSPGDHSALTAALAVRGVVPAQIKAVVVPRARRSRPRGAELFGLALGYDAFAGK